MKRNLLILAMIITLGRLAGAAGPAALTYQGNLLDAKGEAVPDGFYDMFFVLTDTPSGPGNDIGITRPQVQAVDGFFSVVLDGFGDIFSTTDDLWIVIAVDLDNPPDGIQGDEFYSPRQKITSAPYS